jgi:hypothetical protein
MNIFKRKKAGPFEANRILDTNQSKVDQVFTKGDEKPVALLITTTEDEARKIGAAAYTGPTDIGAKGEYEKSQKWVTRGFYWPENISGSQIMVKTGQIIDAVKSGSGTIIPKNIRFEEMPKGASIPISGSATLMVSEGHAELKGIFIVSGSRRDDS